MNGNDDTSVIKVAYTALQPATVRALVEEFVTRDTTDYGERERTLEDKVGDVMRQGSASPSRPPSSFLPGS